MLIKIDAFLYINLKTLMHSVKALYQHRKIFKKSLLFIELLGCFIGFCQPMRLSTTINFKTLCHSSHHYIVCNDSKAFNQDTYVI